MEDDYSGFNGNYGNGYGGFGFGGGGFGNMGMLKFCINFNIFLLL